MSSIRLDIKVCIGTFDIVLEGPSRLAWHLAVSLCSGSNIRGNVALEGSETERRELVDGTNDNNTFHWPSQQISDFEKKNQRE